MRLYKGLVYCLDGAVTVAAHGRATRRGACVELGDGDAASAAAGSVGARFALIAGSPIGEPVVEHGPFVVSTREEIWAGVSRLFGGERSGGAVLLMGFVDGLVH